MRNHTCWLHVLSVLVLSVTSAFFICHATPCPSPWDEILIKHKWDAIPDNWVSLGHPPNGTTIKLHFALKANRENALIDALHEVSHPRNPKYGAHLSREQAAELVAPHPDTLELVFSWLKYNGVPPSSISKTNGGSWITVAGVPVSQANKILRASYELYCHAGTNETVLRTASYALPAALNLHVKTVVPTTAFTSTRLLEQTPRSHSGEEVARANGASGEPSDVLSGRDNPYVVPSFLRWLYRMPLNYPAAMDRNKLGIAGISNEKPRQLDERMFMEKYRTDATISTVTVVPVNGGVTDRHLPGDRGNYDTQYSVALTYPTPIDYYTIGGFQKWLLYMTNLPTVPQTISVPYFTKEPDLTSEYVHSLCNLFTYLGTRGASVLAASGDDGVGLGKCEDPSGNVRFYTVFPASCHSVTSVGGARGYNPELGSQTSGGGFSAFFERPDYQKDAMNAYLPKLGSQYASYYNPLNRGVPDIALQSMKYAVLWEGDTFMGSSTRCATNTAAAIIALLNDYLVSNDKQPLGFLNNWLYEVGLYWDGLNDIIEGKNPGCKTEGFFATDGWDPVTGLGSLNYTLLEQLLIKWA